MQAPLKLRAWVPAYVRGCLRTCVRAHMANFWEWGERGEGCLQLSVHEHEVRMPKSKRMTLCVPSLLNELGEEGPKRRGDKSSQR